MFAGTARHPQLLTLFALQLAARSNSLAVQTEPIRFFSSTDNNDKLFGDPPRTQKS
jgi:hypothetical protein